MNATLSTPAASPCDLVGRDSTVTIEQIQTSFRAFRDQCPPARRSKYLAAEWVQLDSLPYTMANAKSVHDYEELPAKVIPIDEIQIVRVEEVDGSVFIEHGKAEFGVQLHYGVNQLIGGDADFCFHSRLRTGNSPCSFGLQTKARGFDKEAELIRWALAQKARRPIAHRENIFLEDSKNGAYEAILDGTPHSVRFWLTGESNQRWGSRERDADADPMETCFANLANRLALNPRIDFANLQKGDVAYLNDLIANYLGLLQVSYTSAESTAILDAACVVGQSRHVVLPDVQLFQEFAQQKNTTRVAIPRVGTWFTSLQQHRSERVYSAYAPVVVVHPSNYAKELKSPRAPEPTTIGSLDFLTEDNSTGNS